MYNVRARRVMPEETVNNTEENMWKDAPQDGLDEDGNTTLPVPILRKPKKLDINEAHCKLQVGPQVYSRLSSKYELKFDLARDVGWKYEPPRHQNSWRGSYSQLTRAIDQVGARRLPVLAKYS
jgi:hypothetical protein